MKRRLAALLLLCLCVGCALAEGLEDEANGTWIAPVEDAVGESSFELGEDAAVPEEYYFEEYVDTPSSNADCYLSCPDVYDIKNAVSASERVYPGKLVWPLPGTQPLAHVSSHVGWRDAARIHRNQGGDWASWLHHGVDVGHVTKSQVVVAAAGGVAYSGVQKGNGLYVVIDHGNGFYTEYQHLSRLAGTLVDGCREIPVEAGDPIGYVGNSGGDYPVHLHFEIAWSPDGAGSDDETYHFETHNRWYYGYSFSQQKVVRMRWPDRWELCSAEYQSFVSTAEELLEEEETDQNEKPED